MEFREVETKYRADEISIEQFKAACISITTGGRVASEEFVESYDHYYARGDKFIRFRDSQPKQLTMKEKTVDGNNYRRTEVNLNIAADADKTTVDKFCSMLGLKPNFSIYKESFIFWYSNFNTVYYVIYEDEAKTKELGRFIEIEMSEHFPWKDEEHAWSELLSVERDLAGMGLSAQRRVRKSLFEMYRKD